MRNKQYGWNGWEMPILHLDDPDYCEFGCPVCTNARKGSRFAKAIQKIELALTFGGFPGEGPEEENTALTLMRMWTSIFIPNRSLYTDQLSAHTNI